MMMWAGDHSFALERMQMDDGPPWAGEADHVVRLLNQDVSQAVATVVKVQHDLRLERLVLIEILRSLARGNVACAKQLVAEAEDCGGAHGKIEHLTERFDVRVLMEVHDLSRGAWTETR